MPEERADLGVAKAEPEGMEIRAGKKFEMGKQVVGSQGNAAADMGGIKGNTGKAGFRAEPVASLL